MRILGGGVQPGCFGIVAEYRMILEPLCYINVCLGWYKGEIRGLQASRFRLHRLHGPGCHNVVSQMVQVPNN